MNLKKMKMGNDLIKKNEELLLMIDKMVSEKSFGELEALGNKLLEEDTHPSLIASYYIWRHSWNMPKEIENRCANILDGLTKQK